MTEHAGFVLPTAESEASVKVAVCVRVCFSTQEALGFLLAPRGNSGEGIHITRIARLPLRVTGVRFHFYEFEMNW